MTGPRWTAAQIAENLKYPDGRRAFNTPATARSWIARQRNAGKLEHVGTKGPRDARLYDVSEVLKLWREQHPTAPEYVSDGGPGCRMDATPRWSDDDAARTRRIERELGVR